MFTYERKIKVKSCWNSCPLYRGLPGEAMKCCHPCWNNAEYGINMIIAHKNSHDTVPEKCPLKLKALQTIHTITLDIKSNNIQCIKWKCGYYRTFEGFNTIPSCDIGALNKNNTCDIEKFITKKIKKCNKKINFLLKLYEMISEKNKIELINFYGCE